MNNIWAPWRAEYILKTKKGGCVFCDALACNDPLIINTSETCFAIMNRFPYTAGHLMVAPKRHCGDIEALTENEANDMFSMVRKLVGALKKSMQPEGVNVGINLGAAAGAGVADHMHIHIVPRWIGDMNFMPVTADVHMISEHIEKTLEKIKGAIA